MCKIIKLYPSHYKMLLYPYRNDWLSPYDTHLFSKLKPKLYQFYHSLKKTFLHTTFVLMQPKQSSFLQITIETKQKENTE